MKKVFNIITISKHSVHRLDNNKHTASDVKNRHNTGLGTFGSL